MKLSDEYRLSQYKDLGMLAGNTGVHLVRNEATGVICVQKRVSIDRVEVYEYLRSMNIAGIPHIYECVEDGDSLVIVEQYINGRTIDEIVEADGLFTQKRALEIIAELCDILKPLHQPQNPLICRDLKAANIMLAESGRVVIVDFDIARIYRPGLNKDTTLLGTEGYAAPEQFGFGQTDARTDIYALGVLLNYMITGRMPADEMPPGRVGSIISKCTRLKPDERYGNVSELKDDITRKGITGPKDRRRFLPPGFRTLKPWKMIIALLGYAGITAVCRVVVYTTPDGPAPMREQITGRIALWISQMAMVFIACNYCGIRDRIPIVKNRHIFVRIIGYIILEFLLILAAAAVSSLIDVFAR
ncbi:MAG: serine/threonine-protein kinase [Lachnospiraceae bacterium]|nr:serine/threonine-protein kinase [Lachnospiraceae bacterium]